VLLELGVCCTEIGKLAVLLTGEEMSPKTRDCQCVVLLVTPVDETAVVVIVLTSLV